MKGEHIMTKQEMIDIIKETEKDLDQQLITVKKLYGIDSNIFEQVLAEWAGIYRLCKKLGIPT